MRDARSTQLQQALGTALAPLGVTVYEHALTHAGQAYYLIFDVDIDTESWANDKPLTQDVWVETRHYARTGPLPEKQIECIERVMADLGYQPDGLPVPAPVLSPTDYVGSITRWYRWDVVQ